MTSATLTHSSASSDTDYGTSLDIEDVEVTVTDTIPTLQLLTNPTAVSEGENISLTVTSDKELTGNLMVSLTLAARSPSGFDADDIPGILGPRNFTASFGSTGSMTGTVSIATSRDSVAESTENYRIILNGGTGYKPGTDKTADGTLNDGTTSLSIADVTAAEGVTFTFTVTASPASSAPITFKYKVTAENSDTATARTDFTAVSTATEKTIAANEASTTITVTVTDDDESPELEAILDLTIKLGQAVVITASATDADGDSITYAWTRKVGKATPVLPGGPALNAARLTVTPAALGTYTMTVTASDGNGNSQEVEITVVASSTVYIPSTVPATEGSGGSSSVTIPIRTTDALGQSVTFTVRYQDDTATGTASLSERHHRLCLDTQDRREYAGAAAGHGIECSTTQLYPFYR